MGLSRIQENAKLEEAVPIMKRIIEEHKGFIKYSILKHLTAKELKVSVSYMPYFLTYATVGSKDLTRDSRTDYVYITGTDLKALVQAVKDDPWKGYPTQEWTLNGYEVDDAISDLIMDIRKARNAEAALLRLQERIRARKFDSGRREE